MDRSASLTTELTTQVRETLGVDDLDPDEDLFAAGLDSLTLIRLVQRLRRTGYDTSFEELAGNPTLTAWSRLLGEAAPRPRPSVPATAAELAEEFELATLQHAYWVGRDPEQPLGGVAAHFFTEFDRPAGEGLDPGRLESAVRDVVARHPMLRTVVLDGSRQRTGAPDVWPGLVVHDLREHAPAEVETELEVLRRRLTHQRLDVAAGHVLDVHLSLLPGGASRVHVDLDMIAADALSLRVVLDDLRRRYAGQVLPDLRYDVRRYRADAERTLAPDVARDREHWRSVLADLPDPPELPLSPAAAGVDPTRSRRLHHHLTAAEVSALQHHARRHGVTVAAALATAFAEALATTTSSQRFLLNLPLFHRAPVDAEVDALVGDFTSSVLLDTDVSRHREFGEQARGVQERLRTAVSHGAYSGVEVLRDLARHRGIPQVIAPVVYTSAIGLGELFTGPVRAALGEPSFIISQGPQVVLDAQVTELDGGLLLNWDARAEVLPTGLLETAFAGYVDLVRGLIDGTAWSVPFDPRSDHPAGPGNLDRRDETPGPRTLHERFFQHARRAPDATALVEETGEHVPYGELADDALRIAGYLTARGVTRGTTVLLDLPRDRRQVAAALGVLAAGAAYVPLGAAWPQARRDAVRASAAASAALDPTTLAAALAHAPLTASVDVAPEDLAYVLFTSGSTGEPKGVELPHRAPAATLDALSADLGLGPGDRTLALADLEFDMSVFDLFAPLSVGAAAVLVSPERRRDGAALARTAVGHGATVVNCVPGLLDALLAGASGTPLPRLRAVLLGGDRIAPALVGRLAELAPGARFLALGGMTEAAVHSTMHEVRGPDAVDPGWTCVPWGTPLPGVACRVVDPRGRRRPRGVAGELEVAGTGLARGYRGRADLTAERFVQDERDGGPEAGRWYRSGDVVVETGDGRLGYVGRTDGQVKVRGVRIELGEVVAALEAQPGVEAAAAVLLTEPSPAVGAVVVGRDLPSTAGLAAAAGLRLPAAAVPRTILPVQTIPLTRNGKVDADAVRQLLTRPAGTDLARRTPVRTPAERAVAAVWSDLLGAADPAREDDFFVLGGDSLLGTRCLAALRARGLDGRLRDLFQAPDLAGFAARLVRGDGPVPVVVPADPRGRFAPFELTDVQRAYLTGRDPELPLGGVGTHHYTEYDGVDVDLDRVARAWDALVQRHDMLRAVVVADPDGTPRQRVLPHVPPTRIPVVDVTDADEATVEAALAGLRADHSHWAGDPARFPLHALRAVRYWRAGLVRTRTAVSLDYLVLDATSILLLHAELDALCAGRSLPEPAGLTFRDYQRHVGAERGSADAEAYWDRRSAELPPAPDLPTALDPTTVRAPRTARREFVLDADRWDRLQENARRHGLTPSAALLDCYAQVLGAWSGQDALSLTLTVFDRRAVHPDVDRVVGDFTSLALTSWHADPRADGRTGRVARIAALARRLAEDLDHRGVPATEVLRRLARREGRPLPVPVVFTSSVGLSGGAAGPGGAQGALGRRVAGLSQTPQVLLDDQVLEVDGGGLLVAWDAVEEVFPAGVLDGMFEVHCRLVEHLAETADWDLDLAPDGLLPADQVRVRRAVEAAAAQPRTGGAARAASAHGPRLHDGFFHRARQDPGRPAVLAAGTTWTYAELADRALRVGAAVRGVLGARGAAEELVAVVLPKGPEQVAAVLGVLAAGATYVPIGVDVPDRRREEVLARAGVRAVLHPPGSAPGPVPGLDVPAALTHDPLPGPLPGDPGSLAYVIHTSGSSGVPKGVEITHRAAVATVAEVASRWDLGETDRVFALSALDFDLSVFDVFGALATGGALVLPHEDERREPSRWAELVDEHAVTVWNSVPALLDVLLRTRDGAFGSLRLALVSGDWVGTDLAGRLAAATAGRGRLVALGGATEASVWSNAHEPDPASAAELTSVPYGRPLRGQRFRVVGPGGRDCPDLVAGELWIGGSGVARGYRGDPARTAAAFVTAADGERWYRTGDRGRYLPGGVLEFLGRLDGQVKVSGHRLELGEVEAALLADERVLAAVAYTVGGRGARTLRAAVVPSDPGALPPHEVASVLGALADRLPGWAVPAALDVLGTLPLTANGKVDRARLAGTALAVPAVGDELPGGDVDDATRTVVAAWTAELGRGPASATENFFAAGGDSLTALRLVATLRGRTGRVVEARQFLSAPTVAGLAATLRRAPATPDEPGTETGTL
ncbi:amino acid adenylation domain-containing protein [Kineococcus sp. TBRC 1896]|uniref:Phenyloxazoline synthase MbtB n=1 Tax=Kineococcus mangrovi TaxID=1660183 RepID=A0ABV4I065_9ACTN